MPVRVESTVGKRCAGPHRLVALGALALLLGLPPLAHAQDAVEENIADVPVATTQQYDDVIRESDQVRKIFYEQWYHLGKRTLLDVLIAESEYYSNQVAQTNSRFDSEAANMQIYSNSGMLLQWLSERS